MQASKTAKSKVKKSAKPLPKFIKIRFLLCRSKNAQAEQF